jgi:type II secretory pathway component GspD/PulD (secretin)
MAANRLLFLRDKNHALDFFIFSFLSSSSFAISFRLNDIFLRDFAQIVFSDVLKRSFVFDHGFLRSDDVVTVSLQNVDHDVVLRHLISILSSRGYIFREIDGIFYVGKFDNSADDDVLVYRPLYRKADYLIELASLVVRRDGAFSAIRHVRSDDMKGNFSVDSASNDGASRFISRKDSDVVVFQGTYKEIDRLKKLFVQLDKPQGEIMIKAVIYEVRSDDGKGNAINLAMGLLNSVTGVGLSVDVGGVDLSNAVKIQSGNFKAFWSALANDSRFKLVSSPVLRIRSGGTATFQAGQDVPVLGSTSYFDSGRSVQDVEYKSSGVILEIAPLIHDDSIDLDITQQVSSFTQTVTGVNDSPTLLKRELKTSVSVSDDEIIILGGLDEISNTRNSSGFSFFPAFLRGSKEENSKTEILLMLHVQRI